MCAHLNATGVEPLTAAHSHDACRHRWARRAGMTPPDPSSRTCATDAALADALRERPQDYHVNVHDAPFPAGALRGQLG